MLISNRKYIWIFIIVATNLLYSAQTSSPQNNYNQYIYVNYGSLNNWSESPANSIFLFGFKPYNNLSSFGVDMGQFKTQNSFEKIFHLYYSQNWKYLGFNIGICALRVRDSETATTNIGIFLNTIKIGKINHIYLSSTFLNTWVIDYGINFRSKRIPLEIGYCQVPTEKKPFYNKWFKISYCIRKYIVTFHIIQDINDQDLTTIIGLGRFI